MGLCTEFGPQIRHDCPAAMVADIDRCYCPTCRAVCTGMFPGCAKVWARGPQSVTLRSKALGPGDGSARAPMGNGHVSSSNGLGTNGSRVSDVRSHRQSAPPPPALPPGPPAPTMASPDLGAVVEEIKRLGRQIERSTAGPAGRTGEDLGAYFAATNALLETLPDRIAAAIEATLTKQHQMIVNDVETALGTFAGRLARLPPPPH